MLRSAFDGYWIGSALSIPVIRASNAGRESLTARGFCQIGGTSGDDDNLLPLAA